MHRKERRDRSGTGTGRLTHLCLSDSSLFVGLAFDDERDVREILDDPQAFALVLFPGEGALEASTGEGMAAIRSQAAQRRPTIFVLDGSWTGALKIMQHNPRLAALPRVSIRSRKPSGYGFKRQPRPECLSTIEAVHELILLFEAGGLGVTTPQGAEAVLVSLFDSLVTFQLGFSPSPVTLHPPFV